MTIIFYLIIALAIVLTLLFSFRRAIAVIYGLILCALLAIFIYILPNNVGLWFALALVAVVGGGTCLEIRKVKKQQCTITTNP